MDIAVIKHCGSSSLKGTMVFPEVVSKLKEIGVNSYYADLISLHKTYYTCDGSHIESLEFTPSTKIANEFCSQGIKEAILASQKGEISYKEFLNRAVASGVISYMVFINGKKAIYFGKNGDFHIEHFPKPA